MPVPLLDDDRKLGELVARIDPDDSIWVHRDVLVDMLGEAIKPEIAERIRALPVIAGQLEVKTLTSTGVDLNFDPSQVALVVVPQADLRTTQGISMVGMHRSAADATLAKPAGVAGFLNFSGALDHLWEQEGQRAKTGLHADFQSAISLGPVALEADAAIDGEVDPESCPAEAQCSYRHESGLKRRRTRLVYDRPADSIRVQAGDAVGRVIGKQRATDVLGLGIDKNSALLQPDRAGRATSLDAFVIERPSEVEIIVNGLTTRRLRLRPGNYELRDLALISGSNQVEIVITDDGGEQRRINHSSYFDGKLLAAGENDWSLTAGVPSYLRDREREYVHGDLIGSGFYRQGLSDRLTGEINLQADNHVALGGAGLLAGTSWGFFAAQAVLSESEAGLGHSLGLNWDLANFRGPLSEDGEQRHSLRLSLDYRSSAFRQPGGGLGDASGLHYPEYDYWLQLAGTYSMPLGWGLSGTLAARYQFANSGPADEEINQQRRDRYGVDLSIGGALSDTVNGSLTLGYSNERFLHQFKPAEENEAELRVMARTFIRLGAQSHLSASHDSLNRQTIVSGYSSHGRGIDRWEASVDAYNSDLTADMAAGGSLAYYGNRVEARVAHNSIYSNYDWADPSLADGRQRSSVRLASSIAFADGKVAIGAPIRGNGFAIVYPHESLADKELIVGTRDDVSAKADGWGAAVITDLPAYATRNVMIDVDDLPLGYSLGSGNFDLRAPYRGGFAVQVGSGYSVSAFGTLLDQAGAPLELLSGIARFEDDPARQVSVLTNSAGRFAAEGLAAGKWLIEIAGSDYVFSYLLEVPEGTDGLLRAGTLHPSGVQPNGAREANEADISTLSSQGMDAGSATVPADYAADLAYEGPFTGEVDEVEADPATDADSNTDANTDVAAVAGNGLAALRGTLGL